MQAGSTYYVFADAYDGTAGVFSLKFHLQTTVEGDSCPGVPVTVGLNQTVAKSGNTATATVGLKYLIPSPFLAVCVGGVEEFCGPKLTDSMEGVSRKNGRLDR